MQRIFHKLRRYFGAFEIGIMNPDGGLWSVAPSLDSFGYIKAMNRQGLHIFMRPENEGCFLMLDDIPRRELPAQQNGTGYRPGRLVVETSPDNFQVWIKAHRKLSNPEKRYWINYFNSDPACDPNLRWGRCPGFRNRKDKYCEKGRYPLSRLIWVDWQNVAEVPTVNLPDETDRPKKIAVPTAKKRKSSGPVKRSDYARDDASATDFAYVLALLRRSFDDDEIIQRLLSERTDWENHKGERRQSAYLRRTLNRAKEIINK